MKVATVYDVAAHAAVSIATVSRVLRRPDDVRESTRERVLASVQALGYVPSASARCLAAQRTGVLGLFFPGIDDEDDRGEAPFVQDLSVSMVVDRAGGSEVAPPNLSFDGVLRGSEREAWRHGFALMVGVGRDANPADMLRDIAGRVDAVAVLAGSVPDELLKHVSRRIPVVLIGGPRRCAEMDFDHVSVSNREGMRALTAHLLESGDTTDLAFVAGPADSPDSAERYQGFVEALEGAGLDPAAATILQGDFSRIRARRLAETLLATGRMPRALVCANDRTALGMLDVLVPAGVRVPEDVIVTGFDGIESGSLSSPRLTTVYQPMVELGRAAIRAMLSRIEHPDQPPITARLPVKVLLRESSEGTLPS